ncbi:hypothetical protein [Denitromonas iodatirespirans]|uniref:Uncharacterized protein n=1 Tax=Denitromonas iodatirespirans TaxID=2795389 RepID=A0A944HA75_DENI1|nr:hypothetical protein [Denitromonas iodatirespirans]MBT0963999.1 hypothetical protein [Denitromonas iodatirespirans]
MSAYLLRTARLGCLTLGLFCGTVFSQQAPIMPFEDVGVIRAIDPARSTITVDQRVLRITSATQVTADDPALRFSPVSRTWLGRQVGMETDRGSDGVTNILRLHIFGQNH